jgi:hypothetical protein
MREKEWRKLFIRGSTPEAAVRHAGTFYHNARPFLERTRSMAMTDDLPFKVVRSNSHDELARAGRQSHHRSWRLSGGARMYPNELIGRRQGRAGMTQKWPLVRFVALGDSLKQFGDPNTILPRLRCE